jgi:hypothetical protein
MKKDLKDLLMRAGATGYGRSEFLPFAVREATAGRASRGRSDRVDAGGPSRVDGVIGIIAAPGGRKVSVGDSGWQLRWTVRPPADDAERDICRRAMLIRWADRMDGVAYAGGPDDERDRTEWEARQKELADTLAEVRSALAAGAG